MSRRALEAAVAHLGGALIASHGQCGDETVVVKREALVGLMRHLKSAPALAFNQLVDVCGVDFLTFDHPRPHAERFEVVYHLHSLSQGHRLRVRVPVPESDPVVDSVTPLWAGANWFEREVWDMFGVRFRGHPDLRRVLLYEEFQGHPLRKDYPVRGYQPRLDMPRLQGETLPWDRPRDEEA
jgi:NADH-quinone oxidoreductase subunit C